MFKRKKSKRNLDNIGRMQYGFDLEYEKNIYLYVSACYMKKKQKKALEEKHKFNTYQEWREYIRNRYACMDKIWLESFSRYLNQKVRTVELSNAYFVLCSSAVLSVFLAELLKFIIIDKIPINNDGTWQYVLSVLIYAIMCIGCVLLPVPVVLKMMANQTFGYGEEKNLIIDYKEVIDEMIMTLEKKEASVAMEEKCIMIDSDRIEFRNIKADVNIETAQVSISIKQKI